MKIIKDFIQEKLDTPTAVTVGKFDGLHRGHDLLLQNVVEEKKRGSLATVVTFQTTPRVRLFGEENQNLITTEEREADLKSRGIDILLEIPFSDEIKNMSPEDFIAHLVDQYSMTYLTCGTDFTFGKQGLGNVELLRKLSSEYGFTLEVIEKLSDHNEEISSSLIRSEVKLGHMERVEELLGYPYFIWGEIVHGNHIGTGMGIPTINQIPPKEKLLPPNGVYVTEVEIDHKIFHGITNVGKKPSIKSDDKINVETNILDFKDDVYEREAKVVFRKFVRPERKFDDLAELKAQIEKDRRIALEYFNHS